MNDRIHFCISSSLVCSMIGLVFWSLLPSFSQLTSSQEELKLENSLVTISSFLDDEEGERVAMVARPISANRENRKYIKYIPLNVVPGHSGNQIRQTPKANLGLSTAKNRVASRKLASPKLKRHLQQTEKNANELIRQSSDSFGKGLMSLVDYSLALNIAFDTKTEVSKIRETKQAKVSLLSAKQKLIQQAVEQLQNFNQPAAQGWYGDLGHAKLLLSQNQYEIAREIKNKDAQQTALEQISKNAEYYFSIRKAELEVGETDLSEYRRASRSVYISNQERNLFFGRDKSSTKELADFIRELDEIKTEVNWMASHGAGLGRSDLLEFSKAQLTYSQGDYYLANNQKNKSQKLFSESMIHAKAAWSERINTYYPLGTASLHDITTSWIMWKASETKYTELKSLDRTAFDMGIKAGLNRMVNTAEMIRDRRGRIASDISLVRCLKNSELLTDLKAQQSK